MFLYSISDDFHSLNMFIECVLCAVLGIKWASGYWLPAHNSCVSRMETQEKERQISFSLDASSNFLSGCPVISWPGRESQKLYWLAPMQNCKLPRGWTWRKECFLTLGRLCLEFRATRLGDLGHLSSVNV